MTEYPAYYDKYRKKPGQNSTPTEQGPSEDTNQQNGLKKKRQKTPSTGSDQPPFKKQIGTFPYKKGFNQTNGHHVSPNKNPFIPKNKSGIKEWRLIVRNLPFNTKQEDLEKHFTEFGQIKELNLPKNKDKRYPDSCAGYAFIQFGGRGAAKRAMEATNFKEFLGRKIAVDYAIDKDSYITKVVESKPKKKLPGTQPKKQKPTKKIKDGDEIKEEFEDLDVESSPTNDNDSDAAQRASDESETDSDKEASDHSVPSYYDKYRKKSTVNSSSIKQEFLEDDEPESHIAKSPPKKKGKFPEKFSSPKKRESENAIQEGRVVFLRNLGFDVTDENVKNEFSKFGEISLAITCKFQHTDHSKGTAFVHFKEKEAADRCLDQMNSIEGIHVEDRQVYGYRAVLKEEAKVLEKKNEKQPKDNRNLKLLRVSLIRPGTSMANNMSDFDAQKRSKLAQAAQTKLKNLHMFVSPTRLAIHNIPTNINDEKLRSICLSAVDNINAQIKECRIMRVKKAVDAAGKPILGKSKGFAFVEFGDHKDALKCLHAMNNNPKMFTDEKRPIVEFSIENLQALKIKERRKNQKPAERDPKIEAQVEETKRQITAAKPLPKKFGVKIRHRDKTRNGNNKKKAGKHGPKKNGKGSPVFKKKAKTNK